MTDEGKSPKDKTGDFPSSLESAKNALPTFPPPRRLLYFSQNLIPKGASSATFQPFSFRLILRLEKTRAQPLAGLLVCWLNTSLFRHAAALAGLGNVLYGIYLKSPGSTVRRGSTRRTVWG